jgi:hypothetical protein
LISTSLNIINFAFSNNGKAITIGQQLKTSLSFYKIKIPSDKCDQQVQNCKRSAIQAVQQVQTIQATG